MKDRTRRNCRCIMMYLFVSCIYVSIYIYICTVVDGVEIGGVELNVAVSSKPCLITGYQIPSNHYCCQLNQAIYMIYKSHSHLQVLVLRPPSSAGDQGALELLWQVLLPGRSLTGRCVHVVSC